MNDKYDNMSYKECRTSIKEIIENSTDKSAAKAFFSVDGKNYTQTKTDDMKLNLKKWFGSSNKKPESKEEPKLKPAKQKVEETIESKVIEEDLNEIEEDIKKGVGDLVEAVRAADPVDILMLLGNIGNNLKALTRSPYTLQLKTKELTKIDTFQDRIDSIRTRIVAKREVEKKKSNLNEEAKAMSREFSDLENL